MDGIERGLEQGRRIFFRHVLKALFLAGLFLLGNLSIAQAAPAIGTVTVNSSSVSQYALFELTFPISTSASNLYDPTQISVSATFTAPGGKTYTINGFPYQGFNRSGSVNNGMTLNATGSLVWKVRFSPPTTGSWSYTLAATDTGGTSTTGSSSFTVTSSASHGFIQVSTVDPHYFAYSDGTPFFPVGENMDWPDENFDNNIYNYDVFVPKLAAVGGTWIRLWMSDWCFGVENAPGELGNYANSQNQAWCLDYVMNEAAQNGIAVQLCLDYANQYTASYADWANNPYNSANGGPLTSDDQVWTNATAQKYFSQRWRYITARWGYATNLLDYELFNEVDNSDNSATHINNGDVAKWHETNRQILIDDNPQTHMVSTSFDAYISGQQSTWANLDFTQWHQYGNYPSVTQSETAMDQQYVPTFLGYKLAPDYAGEMGTNWQGPSEEATSDPNGIAIHEVNWASLMSHAAAGGFIWWWDNYVDPNNLYFNWKGISAFIAGEDLDKRAYSPKTGTPGNSNGEPLTALYMTGSQKVLGWIEDQNNQWGAKEGGASVGTATAATQQVTGLSTNGSWQVQWWNTTTGAVYSTQTVNVSGGTATLNIPTINSTNPDWAFKMVPAAPVTQSSWRIVAGGSQYTDSQGNVWAADENYSGGQTANTTNAISGALPGTNDQTLYQSERYGNPFTYSFNVPNGNYQVTLKFAETYWTASGDREFNVLINGSTVLTNFDIFASAGGMNKAVDRVFTNVQPVNGVITIQLGPASVDNAKVDAIQVIPQPGTPTYTPTVTNSPTITPTFTATGTPTATYTATPFSSLRINAGGAAYTDSQGNTWAADENYNGGTAAVTTNTISNTTSGTLFDSQRYGTSFSYTFNIPTGYYQVSLLFAETYWTAAGDREFNVSINGATEETNFDVYATAGGQNKAVTEIYNNIAPSGGTITITFGPASKDNAEINAIQIIPMLATATSTPTQTHTSTMTSTYTMSSTPTCTSTLTSTLIVTNSPTTTFTYTTSPTFTGTATSSSVNTATPSFTTTSVFTSTPSNTPMAVSATPSNTSMGNTATATVALSFTPSYTGTPVFTATASNSATPGNTATLTHTSTPLNTATATLTFTGTKTWTPTATNTFTFTNTPTATWTATFTYTAVRTSTPTPTSTGTFTFTPTRSWTPTLTATVSGCAGIAVWNGNFVAYTVGQEVSYNNEVYQCLQSHTSEPNWMPPVVPALWKDMGACGAAPAIQTAAPVVYPNPATGNSTTVGLPMVTAQSVKIQIFTVALRLVQTLNVGQVANGNAVVQLVDKSGIRLANGLYYFRVTADGQSWTVKVLVLR